MRLSVFSSALVACLVGFGGTVAVNLAAAAALGATAAQTTSWVTSQCLGVAVASVVLSTWHRIPIVTAWPTAGAALLAASGGMADMHDAVGAFLLASVLVILTALVRPLGRLIESIPSSIAGAMLAGVLFGFVTAGFAGAVSSPLLVLPLLALYLVARLVRPDLAVLAVLAGGFILAGLLGMADLRSVQLGLSTLTFIAPDFEPGLTLGLGIPLYLVIMASQNLPGAAVLRASGYTPPMPSILATTGIASLVVAPLGAHGINLSAITAAICTGPDAHPDPEKRWQTGIAYGACYAALAAVAASVVALLAAMPPELIATVAAVALIAPLTGALATALAVPAERFPAIVTFAVSASGIAFFGIGAAFWGLAAGLASLVLERSRRPARASAPLPNAATERHPDRP